VQISRIYIDGEPTQEVTLCPLGDIQWTSYPGEDIADAQLVRHVQMCLQQPHPVFVGTGDYIDFASPSNREALAQARTYDSARKEIALVTDRLVHTLHDKVLAPTAGKWGIMVEGHHWFKTSTGMHSDVYLASMLHAPYGDELGVVVLKWRTGKKIHGEVVVVVVHGDGYSVFPWGPLNKLFRLAPGMQADVMIMGHHTKKGHVPYDTLVFETPEGSADHITNKTVHLVAAGGWMKGYVLGRRTYVSKALLNPVTLGQPIIHIRPRWEDTATQRVQRWTPYITVES